MSSTFGPFQPKLPPIDSQIFTRKKMYITRENLLNKEMDIILKINRINIYFNTYILDDKFTIRTMVKKTYNELKYLFNILIVFINKNDYFDYNNLNNTIINTFNRINIIFEDSLK
jgi:hypothetical protein